MTSTRPVRMSLPQTAWVSPNHLQTGVEEFYLSMHNQGRIPSLNSKCSAPEQTTDHNLLVCPICWWVSLRSHHMWFLLVKLTWKSSLQQQEEINKNKRKRIAEEIIVTTRDSRLASQTKICL